MEINESLEKEGRFGQIMASDGEIVEKIQMALQIANVAVKNDNKGDYEQALKEYKECIAILETVFISAPEENQSQIIKLAEQYRARVDVLESNVPQTIDISTKSLRSNSFIGLLEENGSSKSLPDPPPNQEIFRSFWLMKILATTMETGGYLTPKIFVPKSVWYQSGSKIAASNAKAASCVAINRILVGMKEISVHDKEIVAKELELLCSQLAHIQNSLAKALYFIPEYKEEKSERKIREKKEKRFGNTLKKMSGAVSKGVGKMKGKDKLDDTSSYVSAILELFNNSSFLEEWLHYFLVNEPTGLITMKLKRVSDFFMHVICSFMIQDLKHLLERYLRKGKKSFTHLPSQKKHEKTSNKNKDNQANVY